jgi:hypothetical protein
MDYFQQPSSVRAWANPGNTHSGNRVESKKGSDGGGSLQRCKCVGCCDCPLCKLTRAVKMAKERNKNFPRRIVADLKAVPQGRTRVMASSKAGRDLVWDMKTNPYFRLKLGKRTD